MASPYYRAGQYYVDTSTPTAPVLYRCTGSGDKTSSTWAKVSGGGSGSVFADFYDNTKAYTAGAIVQITTAITVGGVTVQPGTYVLRQGMNVPANATGNQVPQFPYPPGGTAVTYWICIAIGPGIVNTCATSGPSSMYGNFSSQF